jgi:hypothetical protein
MGPVEVPPATTAVTWVELFTVKLLAAFPLKATLVAPVRFVPVMITEVPTAPLAGLNPVMVGACTTVNVSAEVAVPPGVVILIGPLLVPAATVAFTWFALLTLKLAAAVPLNATAVAPARFMPVMTTEVPIAPLEGVKLAMVGLGGWFVCDELDVPLPQAVEYHAKSTISEVPTSGAIDLRGSLPRFTKRVATMFETW